GCKGRTIPENTQGHHDFFFNATTNFVFIHYIYNTRAKDANKIMKMKTEKPSVHTINIGGGRKRINILQQDIYVKVRYGRMYSSSSGICLKIVPLHAMCSP
ncbi:MAG: hypothetical protein ACI4B5_08180, partial [Bacteroidaceae bacterium]